VGMGKPAVGAGFAGTGVGWTSPTHTVPVCTLHDTLVSVSEYMVQKGNSEITS